MADPARQLGVVIMMALMAWISACALVQARVQVYQIVRLIAYKSNCVLTKLDDRSPVIGPMRFFAQCENVSFYPDGIEISCQDPDDDRSCKLMTEEKKFKELDLLRPDRQP